MAKRRLPPPERNPRPFIGPRLLGYTVGEWCPTPDGTGPAEAVAVALQVRWDGKDVDIVLRLRTPERVDELIQTLLRHKRGVWPEAP